MRLHVGTSGYSYKAWKGHFYPPDLPDAAMLRFYSEQLGSVEINNTFYRMPSPEVLRRWAGETPPGFRFVLKAPRRISHDKRLGNVGEALSYFLTTAAELGPKLGPVLYQLPPFFKRDVSRLADFLARLPQGSRAAFEFRHDSWFEDAVYEALRSHGAVLCLADTDPAEGQAAPVREILATARWGYLRLRRAEYSEADLDAWKDRILGQDWEEAYVFFKHEDAGRGPALAKSLMGRIIRS